MTSVGAVGACAATRRTSNRGPGLRGLGLGESEWRKRILRDSASTWLVRLGSYLKGGGIRTRKRSSPSKRRRNGQNLPVLKHGPRSATHM